MIFNFSKGFNLCWKSKTKEPFGFHSFWMGSQQSCDLFHIIPFNLKSLSDFLCLPSFCCCLYVIQCLIYFRFLGAADFRRLSSVFNVRVLDILRIAHHQSNFFWHFNKSAYHARPSLPFPERKHVSRHNGGPEMRGALASIKSLST